MPNVRLYEIVIDCADPVRLAGFWRTITGYVTLSESETWVAIGTADERTIIGFQRVPEPKTVKDRIHLDFAAEDEEATAHEIEAMGATRLWVSEDPDDPFVVLADPEGNEFCIVREEEGA
jgi:predicted enzyme related to lactoylglutathione lyase